MSRKTNIRFGDWLSKSTHKLKGAGIPSARLDCLILLEDITGKDRSWLLAHADELLTSGQELALTSQLESRSQREPLAYIRGAQEFYGRRFFVDPRVLIPRPETEVLIDLFSNLPVVSGDHLLDIGTGSGAIGLSLALEHRELSVHLNDIDQDALDVARNNAKALRLDPNYIHGDFADALRAAHFKFVVANLPYVAEKSEVSEETAFEPPHALYAEDSGLALINRLVDLWQSHRPEESYLLIEAEPSQHEAITQRALPRAQVVAKQGFGLVLKATTT